MKIRHIFLLAVFFISLGMLARRASAAVDLSSGTNAITVEQYSQFLNAEAASDPHHLYDPAMGGDPSVGNIFRFGAPGSYSYSFAQAASNAPIMYVGTEASMRFCNWLENNKPSAKHHPTCTETGAYDLANGVIIANSAAVYLLTCEEEINATSLCCNKVGLVVVFNSAATGQMFGGPEVEETGEVLGGDEVGTVITAVGATIFGLATGGRDGEITEHENSDNSLEGSVFSDVHPAGSHDLLSVTEYDTSSKRMIKSGSPGGETSGDGRIMERSMTPPVAQLNSSGGNLKSDGTPPDEVRKMSFSSGDHTSTERNSSGEKLTHEKSDRVIAMGDPVDRFDPIAERLSQENIRRVAAYNEAQKRFDALVKQKEDLENEFQAIARDLQGKKKAADDAEGKLSIFQRTVRNASSSSAQRAANLRAESNRMVQRKNAISTQLSSLISQLQFARSEVTKLSQPLTEPQNSSLFAVGQVQPSPMTMQSKQDGNGFDSSKKLETSAPQAPPKVWEAYYPSESKTDHRKIAAVDSPGDEFAIYSTVIPQSRSKINAYGAEEKFTEPMKLVPQDMTPDEIIKMEQASQRLLAYYKANYSLEEVIRDETMTTEEVRRRVLAYDQSIYNCVIAKRTGEAQLKKAEEQHSIAIKEYLEIPNTPEAQRGHLLAKYEQDQAAAAKKQAAAEQKQQWLDRAKNSRKSPSGPLDDIGRYLYNKSVGEKPFKGIFAFNENKKELYDAYQRDHDNVIMAAQNYEAARIDALPPEEQQREKARIAGLSEVQRKQRIYDLAGVRGPKITEEEEEAARKVYDDQWGERDRAIRQAEQQTGSVWGSGGTYGWTPLQTHQYKPYSSPFRNTVDIKGHVHCSYNGTKLY